MQNKEALFMILSLLEQARGQSLEHVKQQLMGIVKMTESTNNLPLLNFYMLKIAEFLVCSKQIEAIEKLETYESLMLFLIEVAIRHKFAVGMECIRYLFDTNAQYYKYNMLDRNVEFPIGKSRPLQYYTPAINEECDVVKPYLTTTSPFGWVRCLVLNVTVNNVYTIKYCNSNDITVLKDRPLFAPLNSRCKHYEWRMNLSVGDVLDAQDQKTVWYYSTISETALENGVKKVRVTFREFNPNGDKVDSEGRKYYGWGANQDQWFDVMSPRIQPPHTMHKKLDYYASSNHNQYTVQDSFDIVYEQDFKRQPFYSVLRSIMCKSQTILTLFNYFVRNQGIAIVNDLLRNNDSNPDITLGMCVAVGMTSFLAPRMAIQQMYSDFIQNVVDWCQNNYKNINGLRLDMIIYTVDHVAKRVYTLSEKHELMDKIKRQLLIQLLPLNLEKQLLAIKLINDSIRPVRPYTPTLKAKHILYLIENGIFYKLFQPSNTHEQVIIRSVELLKYMMANGLVTYKEIDHLWNVFPMNDIRGRATLEKLISDIVPDMQQPHVLYLIGQIMEIKQIDITVENLNLLRVLKDKLTNKEVILKVMEFLWELLTVKSVNVKVAVEQQVQKVFRSFISTIHDPQIKIQLLKDILMRLKQVKFIKNESSLLKQFISTYKVGRAADEISEHPASIPQAIAYLKKQGIYTILFELLSNQKAEDKIKQILQFMSYLIQKDNDTDVGEIAKQIYVKLGPSDFVLNWIKEVSDKCTSFLFWLFTDCEISMFEKLTVQGFKAIKAMFFAVNSFYQKIKLFKGRTAIAIQAGPKTKQQSTDAVQIQWVEKKFNVLTIPSELIGMVFWQKLLEIVKDVSVARQITCFIVKIVVSLDETLFDQTIQIRRLYLENIIGEFKKINQLKEYKPEIKDLLLRHINILNQFISETEIDGMFDLSPHFQTQEGDMINVKVENNVVNSKHAKEFELIINDNITVWSLKRLIADRIEQNPSKITVFQLKKSVDTKFHGKQLTQMRVMKGEIIKVERARVKQIPRIQLLTNENAQLIPKLHSMCEKWFNQYKQQREYLILENLQKFYKDFTRGVVKMDDVPGLFAKYDIDNDSKWSIDDFKLHILDRCRYENQSIWKFLNLNGYRNDLKYKDDPEITLGVHALPRAILNQQHAHELLFEMLANPVLKPVHLDIYKLLISLPTSTSIKKQFSEQISVPLLNSITCNYRFSYMIGILQMELNKFGDTFFEFARLGGIECLTKKIESFNITQNSIYALEQTDRQLIGTIIKILGMYCFIDNLNDHTINTLYYERINFMDIDQFSEILVKKVTAPSDLNIERNRKFKQCNIPLDYKLINYIGTLVLGSLIQTFKNQYLKDITVQTTRLCAILTKTNAISFTLLYKGLLIDSLSLRRASVNIMYFYTQLHPQQTINITKSLLAQTPTENKYLCTQYFMLASKLLEKCVTNADIDIPALGEILIRKIIVHKSEEKRWKINQDRVLYGNLLLLSTILEKREDVCAKLTIYKYNLIANGLFYQNIVQMLTDLQVTKQMLNMDKTQNVVQNYVSCKSDPSRRLLMKVLVLLYKHSNQENNNLIEEYIIPTIRILPQKPRKSSTKNLYVGLYNLGAICYMNSMLQMLGHVDPFRNGMLLAENNQSRFLGELQKLYSYLHFSERQDYVPEELLKSFTPPIMPTIQQDTTEFLNFLFDHIETQLKPTPYKHLLRQIFEGNTVVQMVCHNCKKKRQRKQGFFCYTVGVKDKNNLQEALEGMHLGEVINDFQCEQCNVRSDFTKRSVLGDIPNVMFIHLQRIVFNLDLFMNTKIHTRLPFPYQLNMQPYTKEGVQLREEVGIEYLKKLGQNQQEQKLFKQRTRHNKGQKQYILNLKGIIVHSGSADVGHYYSIIKKEGGWIKFDDSRVSTFTASSIEEECYGGGFTASEDWAMMGEQSRNAYVLVYEKQAKTPIKLQLTQQNCQQQLSKLGLQPNYVTSIAYQKFTLYNLERFYKQVWYDNHMLMIQTHLLTDPHNKDFLKFFSQLIVISKSPYKAAMICQIYFKLCVNSGQVGKLMEILETCNFEGFELYQRYLSDYKRVGDYLFHNQRLVRSSMATFVRIVIIKSLKESQQTAKDHIFGLLNFFFISLNTEIARNWIKCESFFSLIKQLVQQSFNIPILYAYFLDKHLIAQYIDFIMQKDSPLKLSHKKHQMGNKYTPVDFSSGVKTIYLLVTKSFGFSGKNYEIEPVPQHLLFHFNNQEVVALSCMEFYIKMIKDKQAVNELGYVIHRLAIRNLPYSQAISRVLLTALNETMDKAEQVRPIMSCMQNLTTITDEHWLTRIQMLFGYGQPYLSNSNTFTSIQQDRFLFSSTIENIFPAQCVLYYAFINKQRYPLAIFYILNSMLRVFSMNQNYAFYFLRQPSPNYLYKSYFEWIRPYLGLVKGMLNQDKLDIKFFDQMMKNSLQALDVIEAAAKKLPEYQTIISGTTCLKSTLLTRKVPHRQIYEQIHQMQVYALRSQPCFVDQQTNMALHAYLTHGRLQIKDLHPQSNILYFMQSSDAPLAIKDKDKPKEEAETSALIPLGYQQNFVIDINPNKTDPIVHYDYTKNSDAGLVSAPQQSSEMDVEQVRIAQQQKQHVNEQLLIEEVKKQDSKMELELKKVDLDNIFVNTYFREIIIENKQDASVWIRIQFVDNDVNITNSLLPTCVSSLIKANGRQSLFIFCKYRYDQDWGPLKYQLYVEDGNKFKTKPKKLPFFKIYGQEQQKMVVELPDQQPKEQTKIEQEQPRNIEMQTQKACPACTVFNMFTATECEVCGTPF